MSIIDPTSFRRLTENEAYFRSYNEAAEHRLKELELAARADGHNSLVQNDDLELQFYCECSDENCRQRISLDVATYRDIHMNRNRFIVLPHHEVSSVEKVIKQLDMYTIVEKYAEPPENPDTLHATSVNNE